MARKDVLAQAPGVGEAHVIDPALHAGIEFSEGDAAGLVVIDRGCQLAAEVDGVAALEKAVGGVDDEAGARVVVASLMRYLELRARGSLCRP